MRTICKRLSVVCPLAMLPSTGSCLEVTFSQSSDTTGTVVVSGDPVGGYGYHYFAGKGWAPNTERVCLKLSMDPVPPLSDVWCSIDAPAPWLVGHPYINFPPTSNEPLVVAFWDAWRSSVVGKSYNVIKGSYGAGGVGKLCYGLYSQTVTTFSWCGADSAMQALTHGWAVPVNSGPPKPASCQAYQVPSLDFGTIDPNEISGKKATSTVVVSCDKKASVRVRFMTREGLAIYQMDNGLTAYLKIDDNPGTNGSYQTVAENASSPARAFNLSAVLMGTSGSVKPGAFSYTAVVRVDIL